MAVRPACLGNRVTYRTIPWLARLFSLSTATLKNSALSGINEIIIIRAILQLTEDIPSYSWDSDDD